MKRLRRNPWAALAVLCVGFFMTLLDTTVVGVAIPSIVSRLGTSYSDVLWFSNSCVLALAAVLIGIRNCRSPSTPTGTSSRPQPSRPSTPSRTPSRQRSKPVPQRAIRLRPHCDHTPTGRCRRTLVRAREPSDDQALNRGEPDDRSAPTGGRGSPRPGCSLRVLRPAWCRLRRRTVGGARRPAGTRPACPDRWLPRQSDVDGRGGGVLAGIRPQIDGRLPLRCARPNVRYGHHGANDAVVRPASGDQPADPAG
jgi:hypothetical protein